MTEPKSAGASHSAKMTQKAAAAMVVAPSRHLDNPGSDDPWNPPPSAPSFEEVAIQVLNTAIDETVITGFAHSKLHLILLKGKEELLKLIEP